MVLHEGPNIFARPGLTATAAEWRGTSYAEFLDRLLPLVEIEVVGMLARTLATTRTPGSVYLLSGPGDGTEAARHGWEQAITEAGWNLPGRPCAYCGAADAAACGHVDRDGYRAPGELIDPARAR
jgi:hypothetical protein